MAKLKEKKAKKKRKEYERYPVGMKQQAVERMLAGAKVTSLAEELGIHRSLLYDWKRAVAAPACGVEVAGPLDLPGQRIRELEGQVAQLEGSLGRKALEIDFFVAALRGIAALRLSSGGRGRNASTEKSSDAPPRKAD